MCKETDKEKKKSDKEPKAVEIPEGLPEKAPANHLPKNAIIPMKHNITPPDEVNPSKMSTFDDMQMSDVN